MMNKLITKLYVGFQAKKQFALSKLKDEKGAGALEYILLGVVGIVVVGGILAVFVPSVSNFIKKIGNFINNVNSTNWS